MAKKKNNVPEDLIGFKDFIEYDKKGIERIPKKNNDNNNLLSFLDYESDRLGKTLELVEEQAYTIKENSQYIGILAKQDEIINKNRQIIIELLGRKDSPLTKNLKELLSLHFNRN